MAEGLAVPVTTGIGGGAAISQAGAQLRKVINLALSEGDDDNPFQDLGFPPNMIFAINDPTAIAMIRSRVRRILSKFSEQIALSSTIDVFVVKEGEMHIEFSYVDLESGQQERLGVQLTR